MRLLQWFRTQGIVFELIIFTLKIKVILGPNPFQATDKLFRTGITLVMFRPFFTNGIKLTAEPATDHIDRNPAIAQMVNRRQLFGSQCRLPWTRQNRG